MLELDYMYCPYMWQLVLGRNRVHFNHITMFARLPQDCRTFIKEGAHTHQVFLYLHSVWSPALNLVLQYFTHVNMQQNIVPFLPKTATCNRIFHAHTFIAWYLHFLSYPGRLDRKIEFPLPTEEARAHILRIHSRKMNVSSDVNFEELARCTDDFNGAQLKAVCVEAGMIALRRGATELVHEDYMEGN